MPSHGHHDGLSQTEKIAFYVMSAIVGIIVFIAFAVSVGYSPYVGVGDDGDAKMLVKQAFRFNNHTVPHAQRTSYTCKYVQFPQASPHHIIEMKAIISPAAEHVVHHMILYQCVEPPQSMPEKEHFECDGVPRGCYTMVYGWAVGMDVLTLPDHVGILAGNGTENVYGILQIHYDNPALEADIIDSSGIEVTMTPKLRENNASYMWSGVPIWNINIPPQVEAHHVSDVCGPEQTNRILSTGPIKIIGYIQHAHLLGRRIWTDIYNSTGGKFATLASEYEEYDFQLQKTVLLSKEIEVRAGDTLITHCVYNSMDRTEPTPGGEATVQEMCYMFILYYNMLPPDSRICISGLVDSF